jgi:fructose-1,6-bisphosphatase
MAKGSFDKTKTGEFRITNTNLKLKREIINIAKANQMTYSQWCRSVLIKARDAASEQERNYSEDDGC